MHKMADSTLATALDWTAYTYIGLGILGALVWTRDQIRRLLSKFRASTEPDQ